MTALLLLILAGYASAQQGLHEVESFLSEADSLLKGETTKCSFCSAP